MKYPPLLIWGISFIALNFCYGTSVLHFIEADNHCAVSIPTLTPCTLLNPGEPEEGILLKPAKFWIGLPNKKNSMVLLIIKAGTKVKIMGLEDNYYKVNHKDIIGYIEKNLIKVIVLETEKDQENRIPNQANNSMPVKPTHKINPESKKETPSTNQYLVTKKTSLRIQPDSKSKILIRLPVGGKLQVLEANDRYWWKVKYKGKIGWAKCALLKKMDSIP